MPRIKQTTVYGFNELAPEAKNKALDRYRNWNVSDFPWYEHLIEWYTELPGQFAAFIDFRFSGFSSQGDGASFQYKTTGDLWEAWVHLNYKGCRKDILLRNTVTAFGYRNTHHYSHENTISHDWESPDANYEYDGNYPRVFDFFMVAAEAFAEEVSSIAVDLMKKVYKELENEFDHLTTDESVGECLESSGLEFTEDGEDA